MANEIEKLLEEAAFLAGQVRGRLELAGRMGIRAVVKADTGERAQRKADALAALEKKAQMCRKCDIGKQRTNLVFGKGNPDAALMFIGEAPGYYEDQQGAPFVGRAGQLLDKIINAIGMKTEDVYIGNILKCRPEGNRNPTPQEITHCTPFLEKQIDIISPKIICALGASAAKTLLSTQKSIGALRGRLHEYRGIPLMPTYHPAYLLRNPADKKKTWEDVRKVRDHLLT
ncbi:MAG: uracil-DNA glycosylase [Planctomycetota bacterium]|jgi:DNA polymerase